MKYYIYIYLNPLKPGNYQYKKFNFEFEPFYIGLGQKNRIDRHINDAKYHKKKSLKDNIILKILKNNLEPIRFKLYDNITLESASRLERYLIYLIGRRNIKSGSLSNLTTGGEGSNIITDDIKNRIKKTIGSNRKGKNNFNYGKKWTDEQKENASIKQKETHKHLIGDNNPSKRKNIRKKISESKLGEKNPNAKKWLLISPDNDEFLINGGIKRNLKLYGLDYQQFKNENNIRKNKKGWKLIEI